MDSWALKERPKVVREGDGKEEALEEPVCGGLEFPKEASEGPVQQGFGKWGFSRLGCSFGRSRIKQGEQRCLPKSQGNMSSLESQGMPPTSKERVRKDDFQPSRHFSDTPAWNSNQLQGETRLLGIKA